MRLSALSASVAWVVCATASAAAAAEPSLVRRPFAVVAVVDTGINPYHRDFRRADLKAHPSTYIEGFPATARALDLTLNSASLGDALSADEDKWSAARPNELYWVPGTNIVGAIGPFDVEGPLPFIGESEPHPFYDDLGHGTGVASVAAGSIHGPRTEDVLIVAVKGLEEGLAWAARQPWIDVITNSWFYFEQDYDSVARASRLAVENGKTVCFASHNYAVPFTMFSSQGPSWNVVVGAASRQTRGEHAYTGYPNDVLGLSGVMAADPSSIDDEERVSGTSYAAPNVCGLMAKVIAQTRATLRDVRQGPHAGGFARGPRGRGYLEDGVLSRLELEDAVQATAVPAEPAPPDQKDPNAIPALPFAGFVRGGYGIVDEGSARDALAVILGRAGRPTRTLEDAWIAATNAARDAIWGSPP